MKEEAAALLELQRAHATNLVRIGVFLTGLATILTLSHYLFRKTNWVIGMGVSHFGGNPCASHGLPPN